MAAEGLLFVNVEYPEASSQEIGDVELAGTVKCRVDRAHPEFDLDGLHRRQKHSSTGECDRIISRRFQ